MSPIKSDPGKYSKFSSAWFLFEQSVTYMIRDKSPILKKALNLALLALGSSYFVEISADELLFSGFSDPLLDIANQFPPGIFPPYEKFGWFYNVRCFFILHLLQSHLMTSLYSATAPLNTTAFSMFSLGPTMSVNFLNWTCGTESRKQSTSVRFEFSVNKS